MADYEKINWQNGEAGGTPTSADNFNRMDDGIATAQSTADAAQSAIDSAVSGLASQADLDVAVARIAAIENAGNGA